MAEKRRSLRVRCRLDCTLRHGGGRASGTVRDLSAGGLAVHTDLEVNEGQSLRVSVTAPGGEPVEVDALVWHAHRVRSRQTGETGWLLGLVVSSPPEAWFERMGVPRPAREATPEPPRPRGVAPAPESRPRCCEDAGAPGFVVRVKKLDSPRTRTYRVRAASLAEARDQAERDAGEGWRVIEVRAA